jgi:hypothetical protein
VIAAVARMPVSLWRLCRLLWLRWWLSAIEAEARDYEREPGHNPEQLAVFRREAQAVRVQILTMENDG